MGSARAEPRLATLVIAAAVGPLAMNVFLPSLPGMARYFDTDFATMQLAVSLYLAATDPANPFGSILKWPASETDPRAAGRGPTRTVGALIETMTQSAA